MDYRSIYPSPFGDIELTSDGMALTGVRFMSGRGMSSYRDNPIIAEAIRWLDLYFAGNRSDFMPALHAQGSPFQRRVWRELLNIPYGATATYGDIARRVGCRSAQAVGQAVGRNPIAIIVPCHRVVGSNGSLTGYAYGLDLKKRLLELES